MIYLGWSDCICYSRKLVTNFWDKGLFVFVQFCPWLDHSKVIFIYLYFIVDQQENLTPLND